MATSPDITSFGKRLLPHIVDERARTGYERTYALYPRTRNPADGFKSVSYSMLANAVNRASWWLEKTLTSEEEKENAFVYLGPNDLRYLILVLATMKTGRKMLMASLRNPVAAQLSLFEKVNCKAVVTCSSLAQGLKPLLDSCARMRMIRAPTLDELLDEEAVPHYAFDATYEEVAHKKTITFHTSGSSGNPKPIAYTHAMWCAVDAANLLSEHQGKFLTKEFAEHQNLLILLPCFHAGGFDLTLFPAFFDATVVLGHPDVPISSDYVSQLLKQDIITSIITPPSILEDLSKNPTDIEALAKVKHISYGGGPLPPNVGNQLASRLPHLFSFIGATEYGWFHCVSENSKNWKSLRFVNDIGYRFDEVSEEIFEMVITKDTKTIKYHGNFETFPELQEYRTRDLYSSASLGLWTYRGRADDLIVLSNGEKINPIPMENLIKSHPQVRSALMVGEYRFIPSLMVEMNDGKVPRTAEEQRGSLNEIWPTVQEANKIAPAFAKVPKSLIQFTTRGKPFLRAGKGTVQRQATVKAYSEELEKLFNTQETGLLTEGLTLGGEISSETVEAFTREVCLQAIATKGFKDLDNFANSEDLFAWGTDSLSVMVIVQRLRAVMRSYDAAYDVEIISPRMIYDATSIEKIAEAILITTSETLRAQNGVTRGEKLKRMLRKYSDDIPTQSINGRSSNKGKEAPEPWKVILSGTTGSLGSYLLASLMGQPESKIVKIFCLNRSANSDKRQEKANSFRGLKSSWGKRVEFLQSDFSQPSLGLKKEKYAELIDETTVIIHCAWKVDFNLSIESFEPQIRGVRNLLNFSFNSKQQAPLVFISSISTVLEWLSDNPESRAPAAVLHDFEAPENLGYGESKYVSERLIEEFSKTSGIQTAVFRTGQIAGPLSKKGSWNQQEWLPSTIASSKHLGILPDSLASFEVIDWIPVDVLSDIMIELVNGILQRDQGKGQTIVYNLANPEVTTWFSILPSVQKLVGITKTSSLDDWVRVLETSLQQNNGIIIEQNPAAKLLDFFRLLARRETGTMSRYEVDNLVRDSKVAAQLEAVSQDWMELWLGQWNF